MGSPASTVSAPGIGSNVAIPPGSPPTIGTTVVDPSVDIGSPTIIGDIGSPLTGFSPSGSTVLPDLADIGSPGFPPAVIGSTVTVPPAENGSLVTGVSPPAIINSTDAVVPQAIGRTSIYTVNMHNIIVDMHIKSCTCM